MAMTDLIHADLHERYGTKAYSSLTMHRLGLWLFIISDAFFFTALISSRYFVSGTDRPDALIQELGLALTAVLLLSSLSAYRSEVAASHGDKEGAKRWIMITIIAGFVFLGGVVFEWYEAFHDFPPGSGFGTTFFTLTGIHTTHVISGIILLAFVYRRAAKGEYGPGHYWGVEGAAKYWHFVDLAWVFIYPTLYLVGESVEMGAHG